MRKLIAAINMTLDGFCDHTGMIADDELHDHYTGLLTNADTIVYGRTTYQLMEYWRPYVKEPTGNKATDEFALVMDKITKLVFSRTLNHLDWESATLARKGIKEEIEKLKQTNSTDNKNILVGSPSLILQAMNLNLVDELQLCVHPVLIGSGLPLFRNIEEKKSLKLLKTKTFNSGSTILYYHPTKE